jgi:hypothetical protein
MSKHDHAHHDADHVHDENCDHGDCPVDAEGRPILDGSLDPDALNAFNTESVPAGSDPTADPVVETDPSAAGFAAPESSPPADDSADAEPAPAPAPKKRGRPKKVAEPAPAPAPESAPVEAAPPAGAETVAEAEKAAAEATAESDPFVEASGRSAEGSPAPEPKPTHYQINHAAVGGHVKGAKVPAERAKQDADGATVFGADGKPVMIPTFPQVDRLLELGAVSPVFEKEGE